MKSLAIIPARYASTRFPGKPLVDIQGKPMIQHVYKRAKAAQLIDDVIVATDDDRILKTVTAFNGNAMMTSTTHLSGTDRCAEVAEKYAEFDFIVNIQGDEPFIKPQQIDQVLRPLQDNNNLIISTLAKAISDRQQLLSPNTVKVVFNKNQSALYFSRNAIPYLRDVPIGNWLEYATFYKHLGIYAFRRKTLLEVAQLEAGKLEILEKLEQLRWLENGYSIHVGLTTFESIGIDTPADLERLL